MYVGCRSMPIPSPEKAFRRGKLATKKNLPCRCRARFEYLVWVLAWPTCGLIVNSYRPGSQFFFFFFLATPLQPSKSESRCLTPNLVSLGKKGLRIPTRKKVYLFCSLHQLITINPDKYIQDVLVRWTSDDGSPTLMDHSVC